MEKIIKPYHRCHVHGSIYDRSKVRAYKSRNRIGYKCIVCEREYDIKRRAILRNKKTLARKAVLSIIHAKAIEQSSSLNVINAKLRTASRLTNQMADIYLKSRGL